MELIKNLFQVPVKIEGNIIKIDNIEEDSKDNHFQTKEIFSDKWEEVEKMDDANSFYEFQHNWFLELYGFSSEADFSTFLKDKKYIIDTGCGLGYKAAWFAELAPESVVIGIDISTAVHLAAKNFKHIPNLYFLQADIARTNIKPDSIDFTVCDQVIMHTQVPEDTFAHLSELTKKEGEFACYVYRKKALPRELVDDYFRVQTHQITSEEMWKFSEQLTVLGRELSNLHATFECPDIPVLGIKGGAYDIQRFIYWNFLKCFWKDDWSFELNKSTNYDWYAPSNARRFSKEEFVSMAAVNRLETRFFHEEEACYSGRFTK